MFLPTPPGALDLHNDSRLFSQFRLFPQFGEAHEMKSSPGYVLLIWQSVPSTLRCTLYSNGLASDISTREPKKHNSEENEKARSAIRRGVFHCRSFRSRARSPLDSPRSSAPFHLFDEFSPAISLRITETARVHTLDRVHPVHATTQKYSMRKVFFFVSLFLLSVYGHSGN